MVVALGTLHDKFWQKQNSVIRYQNFTKITQTTDDMP